MVVKEVRTATWQDRQDGVKMEEWKDPSTHNQELISFCFDIE
jgi:hypothetical protein